MDVDHGAFARAGLWSGARADLPEALTQRAALIEERIRPAGKGGMMDLDPHVSDLPEALFAPLPVVGKGRNSRRQTPAGHGAPDQRRGGCACESNALLKALLAHLVLDRRMGAGGHGGRCGAPGPGTVAHVDALLVVSEPSMRSLETAAEVARMAGDLGLHRQVLVLNKATPDQVADLPPIADLPQQRISMPDLEPLRARQLRSGSVLGLGDETEKMLDNFCASLLQKIEGESVQRG